jgi:hypothetical protein
VATVNSVVGGAAVALLVAIVADPPIGVSVAAGGLAALAAFVVQRRWDRLLHERGSEQGDVMFPSH